MRIELRQTTVELGERTVLRGVDLSLDPGRLTVVLGHSGAGLSTLLKTAAGLLPLAGGLVLHDGRDLADLDGNEQRRLQTRTGFMFQDAALWANMTLAGNLDLPLRAKEPGMSEKDRRRRIASLLDACGWTVPLDQRPAQLSAGERRTLSFLRAIVPGPDALLLDEPTVSLDGRWRDRLLEQVSRLRASGVAIAATSKGLDPITGFADDLVILSEGRVLARGTPAEIEASPDPEVRRILHEARGPARAVGRDRREEAAP